MAFLEWLELTSIATFVRESPSLLGYPTFLVSHTFGLSIVVGLSSVIAIRTLGLASGIPLASLERLFPVIWVGFVLNAVSGGGLWLADVVNKTVPGDGRQAPIFMVKMLFVVIGMVYVVRLRKRLFGTPETAASPADARPIAWGLLACWLVAMISGRLIAYSYVMLG